MVISLACHDVVKNYELSQSTFVNGTVESMLGTTTPATALARTGLAPIDVLSALAFYVGIIQVSCCCCCCCSHFKLYKSVIFGQFALGILQLGVLAIILPNTFISGFVSACSLHVFTHQISSVLGVRTPKEYLIPIPFTFINVSP